MDELNTNIIAWAEAKGIFAQSDPVSQCLKFISEIGELADAVNKGDTDNIKLEIGDVHVTLVLLTHMLQRELPTPDWQSYMRVEQIPHIKPLMLELTMCGFWIAKTVRYGEQTTIDGFLSTVDLLDQIALISGGFTMQECVLAAYNKISKRTGSMINGVFVKEGD